MIIEIRHKATDAVLYRVYGQTLEGADLRRADLNGADLERADLRGAFLGDADLGSADLRRAVLTGANLRRANLQGALLRNADFTGAHLEGAQLLSAVYDDETRWPADFSPGSHGAHCLPEMMHPPEAEDEVDATSEAGASG